MEYSYKQSMISPTITTEAPSILINLATVPKAFSCSRQNSVENRLMSSTVSARENTWPYSPANTRSNCSFSETTVHKNMGRLYGAENFIKPRFDSDEEVSVQEECFLRNRKFEKREATEDLSAYFQVTKKRSNSIPNSMLLLNNPLIDKPVRGS
ncbi:hypothetical protein K7432_009323 [Basidiobolus ranarum]|uniref:Uncharacterized protein n=1 Tax=Basidiobolus ranarum TaxID=34480 RepID=A0ABR2VX74_9FUNG